MTEEMHEAREAVCDAAMEWWLAPQMPQERWCSLPEREEDAIVALALACDRVAGLMERERE